MCPRTWTKKQNPEVQTVTPAHFLKILMWILFLSRLHCSFICTFSTVLYCGKTALSHNLKLNFENDRGAKTLILPTFLLDGL